MFPGFLGTDTGDGRDRSRGLNRACADIGLGVTSSRSSPGSDMTDTGRDDGPVKRHRQSSTHRSEFHTTQPHETLHSAQQGVWMGAELWDARELDDDVLHVGLGPNGVEDPSLIDSRLRRASTLRRCSRDSGRLLSLPALFGASGTGGTLRYDPGVPPVSR
jgi:hypothetical protein